MNTFDATIYQLVNQTWTNETLDFLMVKFSDKFFWIPFYCIIIWMIGKQYGKKTLLILLCIGLSVIASDRLTSGLMKPAFQRTRPCHEASLHPRILPGIHCSDTGSMASSHAANHFAVALFMIFLYGTRRYSNVAFWLLWAAAVAYSRVYCGVHYPSDVLVGGIIGALFGILGFLLYKKVLIIAKWE